MTGVVPTKVPTRLSIRYEDQSFVTAQMAFPTQQQ
jgi:hypothetical protein